MEINSIVQKTPFLKRILQFENTSMLPNLLIMCKLMVLLLLAHHLIAKINDPFIPFIPALDIFHSVPNVFKLGLRALLIVSVTTLFLNLYVRTSVIVIGSIVILSILASKPNFYNHTFILGCALFLSGLTNNKQLPWLLYFQLSLVYFGASINKFFDPDWWSGAFMHNWLFNARQNPVYIFFADLLPNLVFAKILSYIAMFTEFSIGILILSKKYRTFGIWFIIIFHTMLFTMTSSRFGHFIESLVLFLIAFLVWPKGEMKISYKKGKLALFRKLLNWFNFDHNKTWTETTETDKNWVTLKTNNKTVFNDAAIKDIILYTPAFYFILFAIDCALYIILYNHRSILFVLNVIAVWVLIIYFLPISWSKYFFRKTTYK